MVPISPQAYSAEAVTFDTKSLFDYMQRLDERRAKRALAEQEAFDEWNKDNEKKLDPTNIRWSKEGDQFTKGLQEYRSLAIDAKNNPRDYTKKMAAQKKADELFSLIRASREAKENDKEYVSFLRNIHSNPEQRKTTDLDAVLRDKAINDLPIGFSAPFLGIKRPEDTAPKMNYYKPAPVNTYDLVQKNLAGIELDAPVKITSTDKDFNYKTLQKYKPEGIVTVAERVGKVVSGDPLLQSSYKVKAQQYNSEDVAKLNLLVKSLKDSSGKPLFPNLEVDIDDPVSIAVGEAVEDMIKREKLDTKFDRRAYAGFQSFLIEGRKEKGVDLLDYDILGKYTNQSNVVNIPSVLPMGTQIVYEKDIPKDELKLITSNETVKSIKKDEIPYSFFIIRPDGDWEGSKQQVISRASVARANLDRTSLSEASRIKQGIIKKSGKGELD